MNPPSTNLPVNSILDSGGDISPEIKTLSRDIDDCLNATHPIESRPVKYKAVVWYVGPEDHCPLGFGELVDHDELVPFDQLLLAREAAAGKCYAGLWGGMHELPRQLREGLQRWDRRAFGRRITIGIEVAHNGVAVDLLVRPLPLLPLGRDEDFVNCLERNVFGGDEQRG
ncbi:hypothetical protein PspLS_12017 [Pyricularia sp. CBS 133598]|nr:hypothetical protein PspLS_12017 [Pyricularia sp. CBS 133598]